MLILSSEMTYSTLHLNQGHAFNENKQTIQSLFFCKILSLKNFLSMRKHWVKRVTLFYSALLSQCFIFFINQQSTSKCNWKKHTVFPIHSCTPTTHQLWCETTKTQMVWIWLLKQHHSYVNTIGEETSYFNFSYGSEIFRTFFFNSALWMVLSNWLKFIVYQFWGDHVILWISAVVKTDPLLLLTPLSISCNCILSQVLHSVPCRPRGTSGAEGRWISSSCLSLIVSPVMHLTIVRSSSNLVVPWDNRGSSSFCVIAWKHPSNISYYKSLH